MPGQPRSGSKLHADNTSSAVGFGMAQGTGGQMAGSFNQFPGQPFAGGMRQPMPPSAGQFPAPMMQQQNMNMMAPPGGYPQQGFPAQMTQMYSFPQPPSYGNFPGMQMGYPRGVPGGFMPAPPPYTQQMAQNYQAKTGQMAQQQQKMFDEQRKKMEAAEKSRKFAEQQKRLKEFSAIGGSKSMNADSLIENILGGKPQSKQKVAPSTGWSGSGPGAVSHPGHHATELTSQSTNHPNHANTAHSTATAGDDPGEDSFGDFMSGPSVPAEKRSADMIGQNAQLATSAANQNAAGNPVTANQMSMPTPPKQEKKDLESMMFECSDLNAPMKAKTFRKPTVSEIQPRQLRAANFHESQKSRKWDSQSEELTELFTLPAQEQPAVVPSSDKQENQGDMTLPKWCLGEANIPPLYVMVLEAVTRDGKIDTGLVYPILMQSGLPREVLGHIWGLANRKTPGELIPEELFMILSLVALAQNNISVLSLDVLMKCPQPLIPILVPPSQQQQPHSHQAPPPQPHSQSEPHFQSQSSPASQISMDQQTASATAIPQSSSAIPQSSSVIPLSSAAIPQSAAALPQSSVTAASSLQQTSQAASPTVTNDGARRYSGSSAPSSLSFPLAVTTQVSLGITPVVALPSASVPDDDFADFQQAAAPVHSYHGSFADFKTVESGVHKSKSDSTMATSSAALIGEEDRYAAFKNMIAKDSPDDDFADFRSASDSESIHSSTTTDSRDLSSSVSSYHSVDHKTCQLEGATVTHGIIFRKITPGICRKQNSDDNGSMRSDDKSLSPNSDDFGDLRTSPSKLSPHLENLSPHSDDFADFQQADFSNSKPQPPSVDFSNQSSAPPDDKIAALKMLVQKAELYKPKPEADTAEESWSEFHDATVTTETEEWADFESAPTSLNNSSASSIFISSKTPEIAAVSSSQTVAGFQQENRASSAVTGVQTAVNTSSSRQPETVRLKSDSSAVRSVFSSQPGYDNFGSFHSLEPPPLTADSTDDTNLAFGYEVTTPGSEEFADFTAPIPHSSSSQDFTQSKAWKDASDSQSNSSLEFTGWKNQSKPSVNKEDSQSVSSLDLVANKIKDSPAGVDSQSVSSLEFGGYELNKRSGSTPDQRSLSSLDLKTQSLSDNTPSSVQSPDDDFGDFSSASVQPAHPVVPPISNNKDYIQNPIDASEVMTTAEAPMVGDRYSNIIPDVQDTDRHISCWQRCLQKCSEMIKQSSTTFNNISSSAVCSEVIQSDKGTEYLKGIVEVYRVVRRVNVSMKSTSVNDAKLSSIINDIELSWANLTAFIATSPVMPAPGSLDFQKGALNADMDGAQQKACGVCLLNVDTRSKSFDREEDVHKVMYSGRQYHASCANFWVNCIEPMLPALKLPELL